MSKGWLSGGIRWWLMAGVCRTAAFKSVPICLVSFGIQISPTHLRVWKDGRSSGKISHLRNEIFWLIWASTLLSWGEKKEICLSFLALTVYASLGMAKCNRCQSCDILGRTGWSGQTSRVMAVPAVFSLISFKLEASQRGAWGLDKTVLGHCWVTITIPVAG